MIQYADRTGRSGIVAYEYGKNYIKVLFSSGAVYLYSYQSAGQKKIEYMKYLAEQGCGLNGFINRYARKDYALHTTI